MKKLRAAGLTLALISLLVGLCPESWAQSAAPASNQSLSLQFGNYAGKSSKYMTTLAMCTSTKTWYKETVKVSWQSLLTTLQLGFVVPTEWARVIENKGLSPAVASFFDDPGFHQALTDCYGNDHFAKIVFISDLIVMDLLGKDLGALALIYLYTGRIFTLLAKIPGMGPLIAAVTATREWRAFAAVMKFRIAGKVPWTAIAGPSSTFGIYLWNRHKAQKQFNQNIDRVVKITQINMDQSLSSVALLRDQNQTSLNQLLAGGAKDNDPQVIQLKTEIEILNDTIKNLEDIKRSKV
jgi:hypothetical protein